MSLVWWSLRDADFTPSILATSREKILLLSVLKYQSREVLCLTFPGHVPEKRWGITDKGGVGNRLDSLVKTSGDGNGMGEEPSKLSGTRKKNQLSSERRRFDMI